MKIKSGQHMSVIGMTGAGKTFRVKNERLPLFDRIIVVDSEGWKDKKKTDFPEFPPVSVKKALKLAHSNYRFYVRVVPKDVNDIEALSQGLLAHGHDLVIDFDEVTDYSTASQIPPQMLRLIRKARHCNITVIVCTQRPQLLNKNFFANSIHHEFFYMQEYDVEHVKSYAPFLQENMNMLPYESYKSIYHAPDGTLVILEPAREYDWSQRKQNR
jgi:DNA helicase HerA-like ATPase